MYNAFKGHCMFPFILKYTLSYSLNSTNIINNIYDLSVTPRQRVGYKVW